MTLNRLGLTLMAAGVLPFTVVETGILLKQRTWQPLSTPLRLHKGTIRSPEFIPRTSTTYNLTLEFERRLDFDRMNCLLGVVDPYEEQLLHRCKGLEPIVDVSWSVNSGGQLVASGSSHDRRSGSWGTTIGKWIGHFDVRRGQPTYVLLEVKTDAAELDITDPHLVVDELTNEYEIYVIAAQISFLLMLAAGGAGALTIWTGWRRKRRSANQETS